MFFFQPIQHSDFFFVILFDACHHSVFLDLAYMFCSVHASQNAFPNNKSAIAVPFGLKNLGITLLQSQSRIRPMKFAET